MGTMREGFSAFAVLTFMSSPSIPIFNQDLACAKAITRGQEAAFRVFYEEVFPRLYRYAQRHTRNVATAEEITQETLVVALERMHSYRGESSLLSWVLGIERHVLNRHGAADARLARFEDDAELNAMLTALQLEGLDDPSIAVSSAEATERVHSVLDRLPPLYAECLEGKYVLGLNVRELAERQGRSEKAVESTLSRAREAFREAFSLGREAEARP